MADIEKTEEEWRKQLTDEQFYVCRQCGTEPPFTGQYWNCKDDGIYTCSCCGTELFDANTKYDSGSGWPSFWEMLKNGPVGEREDLSHGMRRVEVFCKNCNAHLGHVFPDGPQPTGLRYCINSASLELKSKGEGV